MPYAIGEQIGLFDVIKRGLKRRCPKCGEGRAFRGYLKVADRCDVCSEKLGHIRADDLPPYVTILIVGHLIVPFVLMAEQSWNWPTSTHMAVWLPLALALTLLFLPVIKGAAVGIMWRLGLSGSERQ